jgi:hypothetical protein
MFRKGKKMSNTLLLSILGFIAILFFGVYLVYLWISRPVKKKKCESGPNRRPCKREWIKSLYDQCKAAGVEVMVKQMAENEDGTGKVIHGLQAINEELK